MWVTCSKLGHDFKYSSISDIQHQQICSRCGETQSLGNHTIGYSSIDSKKHLKSCSVCDLEQEESHSFSSLYCTKCGYEDAVLFSNGKFNPLLSYTMGSNYEGQIVGNIFQITPKTNTTTEAYLPMFYFNEAIDLSRYSYMQITITRLRSHVISTDEDWHGVDIHPNGAVALSTNTKECELNYVIRSKLYAGWCDRTDIGTITIPITVGRHKYEPDIQKMNYPHLAFGTECYGCAISFSDWRLVK